MFRIQIEMEPFEKEFRQVIFKTNLITSLSMYALLKQWSEEFSLFRLREICERLRSEGFISDSELIQCACASVTSQNLIPINIREALRSLASYSTASASNESHSYSPRQPLPITIGASAPFLPVILVFFIFFEQNKLQNIFFCLFSYLRILVKANKQQLFQRQIHQQRFQSQNRN